MRLLYAQPPPLHHGRASTSQLSPVATLPPPQTPCEDRASARGLLQLNSGGKATGARAESEGAAHVFDFPTRPRCVDVHVIVSDAVKGSHIQRSPLSMGGLCELGAVACSRHKKNIAELIMRKNAPLRKRSCATLGASLPKNQQAHDHKPQSLPCWLLQYSLQSRGTKYSHKTRIEPTHLELNRELYCTERVVYRVVHS